MSNSCIYSFSGSRPRSWGAFPTMSEVSAGQSASGFTLPQDVPVSLPTQESLETMMVRRFDWRQVRTRVDQLKDRLSHPTDDAGTWAKFPDANSTPFSHTEAVSSASTFKLAFVIVPVKLNVSVKVTAVPFGNTVNPGADGLPVFANEIQPEPGSGAAHAGFREITWVALAVEFVVAVELATDVESARASSMQPLAAIKRIARPNSFTICILRRIQGNIAAFTIASDSGNSASRPPTRRLQTRDL